MDGIAGLLRAHTLTHTSLHKDRQVRRHPHRAEIGTGFTDEAIHLGVTDSVGQTGPERGNQLVNLGLRRASDRCGHSGADLKRHGQTMTLGTA
jgi:hypothetical protein